MNNKKNKSEWVKNWFFPRLYIEIEILLLFISVGRLHTAEVGGDVVS
jgi:hypothetical protein